MFAAVSDDIVAVGAVTVCNVSIGTIGVDVVAVKNAVVF